MAKAGPNVAAHQRTVSFQSGNLRAQPSPRLRQHRVHAFSSPAPATCATSTTAPIHPYLYNANTQTWVDYEDAESLTHKAALRPRLSSWWHDVLGVHRRPPTTFFSMQINAGLHPHAKVKNHEHHHLRQRLTRSLDRRFIIIESSRLISFADSTSAAHDLRQRARSLLKRVCPGGLITPPARSTR